MTPTAASAVAASLRVVGEVMYAWFPPAVQAPDDETPRFGKPRRFPGTPRSVPSRAVARLLVIEDDAAISEPLVRALAREGHDVDHAATGAEALDRLADGRVDLVVLDLG